MSTHSVESLISAIANYSIDFSTDTSTAIHELNGLFQRLHNCTQLQGVDPSRGTFLKEVSQLAHSIYVHVFVLIQHLNQQHAANYDPEFLYNSATEAQQALTKILRFSFTEDYRTAIISFGLVNAICQLLVLDVAVFGLRKEKLTQETRRIVGNALTNLSFANIKVKLSICGHGGFLDTVTQLIDSQDELLQAYAALIRNLSWNADTRMTQALAKTTCSLSRAAAIRLQDLHRDVFTRKDPHDENKALLAVLSALWNLASHSLENKRAICETQAFLFLLIINLTNNPDRTLFVENATGILKYVSGYVSEHEHLLTIVHEAKIVKHLLSLLSSSSFTVVLNALGSLGALVARDQRTQLKLVQSEQARMILESLRNSTRDDVRNGVRIVLTHLNSSPLSGFAMTLPSTSRLNSGRKEMRTSYDSNVMPHLMSNQQLLPYRQVAQNVLSPDTPTGFNRVPIESPRNAYSTLPCSSRPNRAQFVQPINKTPPSFIESGLTESQLGTCSGSVQSLTNDVPTNWQSNITTSHNSGKQSPISPSNLPDSPSNFFPNDEKDEDEQMEEESRILIDAINSAMPKPRSFKLEKSDSVDDGTAILTQAIESVMPKARRRDHLNLKPTGQFDFKSNQTSTSSRPSNSLEQSALLIRNTTEKVRDASKLEQQKPTSVDSYSEDNFYMADVSYSVDTVFFPQDVEAEIQADQLVINCSNVSNNQKVTPRQTTKSIQDKQPDPSEAQLKKINRSARISPFNYRKPVQKPTNLNEKSEKCQKSTHPKASITVANL